MRTTYVTDDFSSLGGLGAVAYGDPEYFREVANQIYAQSPTQSVDVHRPSDTFESLVASKTKIVEIVKNSLSWFYQTNEDFADYVDVNLGPDWLDRVERDFYPLLQRELDSNGAYGIGIQTYLNKAIEYLLPGLDNTSEIVSSIVSLLDSESFASMDSSLASLVISNNPQTKLSNPPPNSKVVLSNSVDLGLDYRSISYTTGYSTLEDYWSNVPYPGVTDTNLIPSTLAESISNGYVGYLSNIPLEALYNPVGANSINTSSLNLTEALNFSDQFGTGSVLAQLPELLQGDTDIYSISLIGETLNGFTSFDPATMSNGDAIDTSLIPDFEGENSDPDSGLPGLARSFSAPF